MLEDDEFRSFLRALGIRIRLLRKEKKINMREIGSQGFYESQWRKYETGGSVNLSSLMKIALALKVNLRDLLDGLAQWPDISVAEIQAQHSILPDSEHDPELDVVESEVKIRKVRSVSKKVAAKPATKQAAKHSDKRIKTIPKVNAKRPSRSSN